MIIIIINNNNNNDNKQKANEKPKTQKINLIFQIIYSDSTTYGDCKEFEKRTNFCYFCYFNVILQMMNKYLLQYLPSLEKGLLRIK